MLKFGGTGRSKQCCVQRRCPNMAIQEADDSDPEDEEEYRLMSEKASTENNFCGGVTGIRIREKHDLALLGQVLYDDGQREYYG